jgi:hypothetical protein
MVNRSMCVFVHSKQTLEPWCLTLYPPNYQDIHHIPELVDFEKPSGNPMFGTKKHDIQSSKWW